MNLSESISELKVPDTSLAVFWVANASFILKTPAGLIISLDLYLSELAEKAYGYGFRRIMPALLGASELKTDLVLATHHHEDHLDLGIIPGLMENGAEKLVTTPRGVELCKEAGVDQKRLTGLKPGDRLVFRGIEIYAVYADHGDLAPDAIGFVIDSAGIRVYVAGDTAYRPDEMAVAFSMEPDITIAPINGRFGNLSPEEAAYVVRDSQAKVAIPSHFWMFPAHGGDPGAFFEAVEKYAPQAEALFMTAGSHYIYTKG